MRTKLITLILLISVSLRIEAQKKTEKAEAYSSAIQINFKAKDVTAPEILIDYGQKPDSTSSLERLVITVEDKGGGITMVTINDKTYAGEKLELLKLAEDYPAGTELNIKATDISNNVKEKNFQVRNAQPMAAPAVAVKEYAPKKIEHHYYAILFAAQDYSDPDIQPLTGPINDAEKLKEVLLKNYTFEEKYTKVIKNPTYETLVNTFDNLRDSVTDNDYLLLFYAGHGHYDPDTEKGWWLPVDATKNSKSKWYRNSSLKDDIESIHSKSTLLISDACFSGSIFNTRAAFSNNASVDISHYLKKTSRRAVTSGTLTEVPDKSVFLKYLIQGLEENDMEFLKSEDLFDEIKTPVKNNSSTEPKTGIIQGTGDEGGDFVFIRKRN